MLHTVESLPQADLLLHSLRSVGYSEEAAIADIVDNSISADASNVYVNFDWDNQILSIVDDGEGMRENELYKNMQIGSFDPQGERSKNDLGRFGMGMKTAAFSLGRKLIVLSKRNGKISNASWDLDQVKNLGWKLLVDDSDQYNHYLKNCEVHGTAIIISKLDNLIDTSDLKKSKSHFYKVINQVEKHLQLVFHRFIMEDQLNIYVNGNGPLEPWDPFVLNNSATQELSDEDIWDLEYKTCTHIQPYVIPHKTMYLSDDEYEKAEGDKGWYRNQGIYLYRNRRLIIYGTWFDLIKKDPVYNLARIRIDISADADKDWKIDIKKSRASMPVYMREKVMSAIEDCTSRSMKTFNSRGTYSKHGGSQPLLDFVWEQVRNDGYYSFKLNKKHPLLMNIRKQLDDDGIQQLQAYLSLVENFAPYMKNGLINMANSNNEHKEEKKKKDLKEIQRFIITFHKNGFSKEDIKNTILNMAAYSYLKDQVISMLEEIND